MSAGDALENAEVKKSILRRYDINEEMYRQRFRTARRKEGEPYIELATWMADLFQKWTADCDTVAAISEKLLIEQLLDTMPTELRIWLSEKKPATMREAGKLADDYVLARQRNHKEPGAKQSSSPNQSHQCFLCGKHGHWARNCPEKPPTARPESGPPANTHTPPQRDIDPRPQPDRKCYNCHKRGHLANRCPSRELYCGTLGGKGSVGG